MPSLLIDNAVARMGTYTRTLLTFATLPSAANNQGMEQWISDSTNPPDVNYGQIAVGGGTFNARVVSDGAAWRLSRGSQD